ncbi:pentatricopeptide repeat-containing protein At3g22470, mitochondrial-like [Nicotiana tomentosiformis]|uniref:pentatricopeptide repeat-containing protein At3g22470, mitochondrial-like n=1 Tax=Nicotiana tomentosiformis TaxID=4098 RepID=UPI00388C8238
MEQGSTKPDTYIYSIVIDAFCKDRMLDVAISLLKEMIQKGIPLNIVTYSSFIDGLCKSGEWDDVRMLFCEMVNLNIYLDVYTFKIVIHRQMIGKGVEPTVITYNMIIDGYCLLGQVDKARRTFNSMIDNNIEPDIINYNILINGYCKKKKLDEAMKLFSEVSQRG